MSADLISEAIKRAEKVLDTAFFGLNILKNGEFAQRSAGLRNVLVFGRSVTFVIQNLRSIVGEQRFDDWYIPRQDEMRADPLMKYFVEARNNLEKQGRLDISRIATVHHIDQNVINNLERPPFYSDTLFIGDETGGSGWSMDLGSGEKLKYYINIPASVGDVKQVFDNLPAKFPEDLRDLPVETLCEMYLERIKKLFEAVKKEFQLSPKERPYLRVVR